VGPPSNAVTEQQREACIEYDGWLYATIDFTKPSEVTPWGMVQLKNYSGQEASEKHVTEKRLIPPGWELVPSSPDDIIKEKVIKIYPWGTHLLVCDGGNAYCTAKGDNPGSLESIWDYDTHRSSNGPSYALQPWYGGKASYLGKMFMRRKNGA